MAPRLLNISEVVIPLHMEHLENGEFLATSKALPGLIAQGRSMAEAVEIAQDVGRKLIESYQEHGDPLPPMIKRQIKRRRKTSDLEIPIN